jgi:oligosaccharide translocation protein RFT1
VADAPQREQAIALVSLVKTVSLLGLVMCFFGPPFARLAIHILYSSKWSAGEAPRLLALYCIYLSAMAVNGVTEAFVHAVSSGRQLSAANLWLVAFSAAHMTVCYFAVGRFGAAGLVGANCLNMVLRSAYSLVMISRHFRGVPSFSLGESDSFSIPENSS